MALIRYKPADEWCNVAWRKSCDNFLGHDSLGHACACQGSDAVASDVPFGTLFGKRLGESEQTKLGGRVIDLAKGAKDSSTASSVYDTAVVLLSHDVPCGTSH